MYVQYLLSEQIVIYVEHGVPKKYKLCAYWKHLKSFNYKINTTDAICIHNKMGVVEIIKIQSYELNFDSFEISKRFSGI